MALNSRLRPLPMSLATVMVATLSVIGAGLVPGADVQRVRAGEPEYEAPVQGGAAVVEVLQHPGVRGMLLEADATKDPFYSTVFGLHATYADSQGNQLKLIGVGDRPASPTSPVSGAIEYIMSDGTSLSGLVGRECAVTSMGAGEVATVLTFECTLMWTSEGDDPVPGIVGSAFAYWQTSAEEGGSSYAVEPS